MSSTWGKSAEIVRKASLKLVDEYPQKATRGNIVSIKSVYNTHFTHVLTLNNPLIYPQPFSRIWYLLRSTFSPQSTQPITITTNFKKEER